MCIHIHTHTNYSAILRLKFFILKKTNKQILIYYLSSNHYTSFPFIKKLLNYE